MSVPTLNGIGSLGVLGVLGASCFHYKAVRPAHLTTRAFEHSYQDEAAL